MKLFNKTIDNKLFKQYSFGSDLSKQKVVAKIFNPYGNGTWYILNSDPNDPDYLWAIVDLGYGAEVGSVSRSELETYRNRMRLGFERDMYFDEINAKELYNGLLNGESYDNGGDVSNDVYEVKHSKENNTYQVWKSDFLVTDFVTKKEADAVAKRLNSLYSYDNGGETNDLEIGQKYRAKNGDILTIKDFDVEDHVTTDDGKGKMSSMGIQRISVFKELIKDGELVHLSENGSEISSREQFINKEIQSQKEKEKDQNFKLFRVNVYEQNENKGAYPFVEPYHTDNFVEALNFAKETIKKQRSYRSNSGTLWTTIDSFTPIEKRENVRYPYSELIRFDEKNINTSKFNNGGEIRVGDKVKVKASGIGEDYAIVKGFDSDKEMLTKNDDPNTYLAVKDSNGFLWEIYLKEVVGFPMKRKFDDGGEVSFIDYKDSEIMYEPNYKKYYANDVEFDSLQEAKDFLDSGEIDPSIRDAYKRGLFENGGNLDDDDNLAIKGYKKYTEEKWSGNDYFSKKYALNELAEFELDLRRLEDGKISPSKIIGTGYKNPKKIAKEWLESQIKKQKSIIETNGLSNKINYSNFKHNLFNAKKENIIPEIKFNQLIDESNEIMDSLGETYATGGYMTDPNFGDFQSGVYAKGGGLKKSLIPGTSGRWIAELPHAKYKITKEVTNAQSSGKNNLTYTNIVLPKGSIVHNLPGGVFVENEKLKEEYPTIYNSKYGLPIIRKEETLNQIYNNSEILE